MENQTIELIQEYLGSVKRNPRMPVSRELYIEDVSRLLAEIIALEAELAVMEDIIARTHGFGND